MHGDFSLTGQLCGSVAALAIVASWVLLSKAETACYLLRTSCGKSGKGTHIRLTENFSAESIGQ